MLELDKSKLEARILQLEGQVKNSKKAAKAARKAADTGLPRHQPL